MSRLSLFAALALATVSTPALAAPEALSLDAGWQARIAPEDAAAKTHPREAQWFAVPVPGTVQQALVEQHRVPDPFLGTNEAAIQWAGLSGWEMRRTLNVTAAMLAHGHLDLVFDGIDTFATVSVNGQDVLKADNAHRSWRVPVRGLLHAGANEIVLRFASPIRALQPMVLKEAHPLPGEYDSAFGDEPKGVQTSPYIRKPKYQYGWDWGPRIVNIGLWHGVRLEGWDGARLATLDMQQDALGDREARLTARLAVEADSPAPLTVELAVTAPDGTALPPVKRQVPVDPGHNVVTVPITIPAPQRWWPVGLGAQPLYKVAARIVDGAGAGQAASRTLGLRTVELMRGNGAFGFKVNGVPVFAKGANLIPFDSFPSRVTAATMDRMLADARAANMNMIRVWGGGTYLDDAFYDSADRLGLMIWQDFMFGGAVPPPDAAYRASVAAEADEQVARLSSHPSIVVWTGGNEVLSGWANWSDRKDFKRAVGPDEQERIATSMTVLFDRVLRDAVAAHSPQTPYWPGSPSTDYEGPVDTDAAGDRHFWDVWSGSKPVENYLDTCPRFMSEYGFQAMPGMATIAEFAGPKVSDPQSPVMKAHQKFLAGEGNSRLAFYLDARLRPAQGSGPARLADFVYLTQVNQMQAIDMAARHHRACAPVTMGSLYWQLNDVWPAISWSSIDHAGRWKLLHYAARRFFAPQAVVAEHKGGTTRVVLVSDAQAPLAAHWRLTGRGMDGAVLGSAEGDVTLAANGVTEATQVVDAKVFGAAAPTTSYVVAELSIGGSVVSRQIVERALPKTMAYPDPGLSVAWHGRQVTLTARNLARAVMLDFGTLDAAADDNGFDLLPGESRTLSITSAAPDAALRRALVLRTLAGSH
ncbi:MULTISPECIES: glycoside hydrolase family 2 protein [unclassified Novosphingobium]|uniref:beta-mannosidase n=1 Tax=unclassified Novosphingobium TaxID=2644732 RepID=UPI00146DE20E|nr:MULTISPECIES: glycoside hydrolase family 2 protein [unclassified Novosphingobium]NMN03127.1 beta-mannosidase [Novosphingobium sp. SG919]NMN86884.1 beta-mannosidase [Novosphingobium sp. SG916]